MGTGNRFGGDNQPHDWILQHPEYLLWGGGGLCHMTLFGCSLSRFLFWTGNGRRGDGRTDIPEPREDIGLVYGSR